jgi:hypothetical protein
MSRCDEIPAHEFAQVFRQSCGAAVVAPDMTAFDGNPLADFTLAFTDRASWQRAWRMVRVNISYGFDVMGERWS